MRDNFYNNMLYIFYSYLIKPFRDFFAASLAILVSSIIFNRFISSGLLSDISKENLYVYVKKVNVISF